MGRARRPSTPIRLPKSAASCHRTTSPRSDLQMRPANGVGSLKSPSTPREASPCRPNIAAPRGVPRRPVANPPLPRKPARFPLLYTRTLYAIMEGVRSKAQNPAGKQEDGGGRQGSSPETARCHAVENTVPRMEGAERSKQLENRQSADQHPHPALALLAARPDLFARQGSVVASWRRRGTRISFPPGTMRSMVGVGTKK